jgi:DNA mismatch endonuclease (patch repair protein)
MSGIKGKNTSPELFVRKAMHARGFRFRIHVKDLPGKPDLVLPKYNAVIFIHGCFWHGHNCRYFKVPKTRPEFWINKIEKNKLRDSENIRNLLLSGWRVIVIWECAIRKARKAEFQPPAIERIATCVQGCDAFTVVDELDIDAASHCQLR